ncbi:hypothetical protein D3C71_2031520 [compost metagenome]
MVDSLEAGHQETHHRLDGRDVPDIIVHEQPHVTLQSRSLCLNGLQAVTRAKKTGQGRDTGTGLDEIGLDIQIIAA